MRITADDLRHRLLPILLSQGIGLICGLVGVSVTSHWVKPADYGAYGVFVSFASVGAIVVYTGVIKFVTRYWLQAPDRGNLLHAALRSMFRKTGWLLVGVAALTVLSSPNHPWIYGGLLFVSAVFFSFAQLAQSALQAAREHWRDLGLAVTISVNRSFLPPLLYVLTSAGQLALFLGFTLQAAVGAGLGALTLRRWKRNPGEQPTTTLAPIYEGPWFVALAVVTWLLAGLHRWLAAWFFGAETAGYFTLAGNVGNVLPAVWSSVILLFIQPNWFSMPIASFADRKKLAREADRIAGLFTVVAVSLAVGLQLTMPWLVGRVIGIQYADAAGLILMTSCAAASGAIGLFYHIMLLAAKLETACPPVDLSGAACLVLGSVLSAAAGLNVFKIWLVCSPLVPWLVNRTLARRRLFLEPDVKTATL